MDECRVSPREYSATLRLTNENARDLAASGVFRVPHSSSDQTPSGVPDDESSVAAVLFRLPAKPSVPLPISLGSRIIGQAADVLPEFDLPLHLPLDSWRFCRLPSATSPTTEAVNAVSALGGLHTSCQTFVPAPDLAQLFRSRSRFVDEISAFRRAPSR